MVPHVALLSDASPKQSVEADRASLKSPHLAGLVSATLFKNPVEQMTGSTPFSGQDYKTGGTSFPAPRRADLRSYGSTFFRSLGLSRMCVI